MYRAASVGIRHWTTRVRCFSRSHIPLPTSRKTNRLRALAVAGVQAAAAPWRRGSASCELLGSWLSRLEFLYMSETSRSTIRLLSVTACADSPAVHHRSLTKSVRYLSTQGHCTASKYAHLHCHSTDSLPFVKQIGLRRDGRDTQRDVTL